MNFNFELILFYATLVTGIIVLMDVIWFAPVRHRKNSALKAKSITASQMKLPLVIDYSRSFFPILLLVFLLRSFLYEPFRIPSGSLEPTLLIGDLILVNKFDYGVRLPIMHKMIYPLGNPQRGDILIFRWPPNPSFDFIKRVIGVPGDHISYLNKTVYINGNKMPQQFIAYANTENESGGESKVEEREEDLMGIKHKIYVDPSRSSVDYKDIVVPAGMYFVMGDNRDDSADSRYFGFVPDSHIVGKAVAIWMSWDSKQHNVRWNRLAKVVH